MEHAITLVFDGYRVTRLPGVPGVAATTYEVRRPDGSVCCAAASWVEVETIIGGDQESRGASAGRG